MKIVIAIRIDFQTATPLSLLPANTNSTWAMERRMREVRVMVFGAMFLGTNVKSQSAKGDHIIEQVILSFPPEYLKALKFYTPLVKEIVQDLLIYSGIKIIEQTYSSKYQFTQDQKYWLKFIRKKKWIIHLLFISVINRKGLQFQYQNMNFSPSFERGLEAGISTPKKATLEPIMASFRKEGKYKELRNDSIEGIRRKLFDREQINSGISINRVRQAAKKMR